MSQFSGIINTWLQVNYVMISISYLNFGKVAFWLKTYRAIPVTYSILSFI